MRTPEIRTALNQHARTGHIVCSRVYRERPLPPCVPSPSPIGFPPCPCSCAVSVAAAHASRSRSDRKALSSREQAGRDQGLAGRRRPPATSVSRTRARGRRRRRLCAPRGRCAITVSVGILVAIEPLVFGETAVSGRLSKRVWPNWWCGSRGDVVVVQTRRWRVVRIGEGSVFCRPCREAFWPPLSTIRSVSPPKLHLLLLPTNLLSLCRMARCARLKMYPFFFFFFCLLSRLQCAYMYVRFQERNRFARAGEADRKEGPKLVKHLIAGKMGLGTRRSR